MVWENNIMNEMKRMKKRMNRLFNGFQNSPFNEKEDLSDYRKAWADFKETDNEYIMEVELPGIDKKDIILSAIDNKIEIRARKKQELEQKDANSYSYSKSYNGFARSVSLPEEADINSIDAEFENGILIIKIPRKKTKKDKKEIKIN